MKILELRFKNLNSLYGEWIIDFTNPEYVSNGIFALTGSTGAGKSTILDAICLALYGSTPRLSRITKSANEIMSRQTGECYAEVLFESQSGRFRCHWEQRRARKKADGELQSPRHEIAEGVPNGKVIENQLRSVQNAIEEKTGMDFERFTRSILLAQGGFDTFLRADTEQKSKILEQITGTEIYSQISIRVHERERSELEKLNLLQAETTGIVILDPEHEKEIQLELDAKKKEEIDISIKFTETGRAITWLTTIDGLKKELISLKEETTNLQADLDTFKPERFKLELAIKAASLDGVYAALTALRKQQSDDHAALKKEETTIPELETSAKIQAESLKIAEQLTIKAKEELKAAAPLIQQIRLLDHKIIEKARTVSESSDRCTRDATKIKTDKQILIKEHEKQIMAEKSLNIVKQYLKEHAQDEWLISGLTGIEEQIANLLLKQKEIKQKEADSRKADKALEQAIKKQDDTAKQSHIFKQELEKLLKNIQQGKDALSELLGDKMLREYRTEKETLLREMAFIKKIEELEDHRTRLEDGKPCPLCGSIDHPFAAGNIPVPDETERKIELLTKLIDKADNIEEANKKLEQAESAASKKLTESDKLEATAQNDKMTVEKTISELKGNLEKLRASFDELKSTISVKLQPLGITEIPKAEIFLLLESLKSRLKAWQEQAKQKNDIEKQIAALDSEVKRMDAVIDTQVKALVEKQDNLERLKKEVADVTDERKHLYGDKKPDEGEALLNKAIADADKAEKKARDLNTELQQKLVTAKNHVESLKKRTEQREPELKEAETGFTAALTPAGFADEKLFLESRLNNEKRESLSFRARELDKTQTELKTKLQDRENRLTTETGKKITDKPIGELELQFKEYEESQKILRDAVAMLEYKLKENTAAKERIKEKQFAIEAQKKECLRWGRLHNLIGSADGKKYRNFAQGLTFELMVSHANRQLEKMTDRYLLVRDDEQPLELNVVDNYQAGEIRSTRNLSGGESFIVSLTLALGLSKMASRKVRVDSLFLDEGFGTLDNEALETALETLSELQQDGKLIGIISHVSALKERISTQINIAPVSGGKSIIVGPGISSCKS